MKNLLLSVIGLFCLSGLFAQDMMSVDELKSMKAEKEAALGALQAEVDALDAKINTFPGWKVGGVGIAGFDLNGNNNWFQLGLPNSRANGLGLSLGAFANLDKEKFFWRNLGNVTLKSVNTTLDTSVDEDDQISISNITDNLDISSLAGYKLSDKWALSAEGKYISTVLNFNDPGKLILSAGATWTPIQNLVVIIHPLGYEFNFPGDSFVSSAGAKIGATYAAQILPGVAWSSNLSTFIPYSGGDGTLQAFGLAPDFDASAPAFTDSVLGSDAIAYEAGDLFNWTWINSFSTSLIKGIGLGLNIGLRQDRQLSNQAQYNSSLNRNADGTSNFDFGGADNPIQLYYTLGLSYNF